MHHPGRRGFTLVEVMIATALMTIALVAVFVVFAFASRLARAGLYQVQFTGEGRIAQQKITRLIEEAKAIAVSSNGINLIAIDLGVSRIYFDDGDGNEATVDDNKIFHDPDLSTTSDTERVLCTFVSPMLGHPLFAMSTTNAGAAAVRFHVGDGTNVQDAVFSRTGIGYQGLEVRFSAAPRNLQLWYN
ncbi:prepilin-type N-terminal cleavage/methylation domain-containing protein [Verrucomicrobiota bacterium]